LFATAGRYFYSFNVYFKRRSCCYTVVPHKKVTKAALEQNGKPLRAGVIKPKGVKTNLPYIFTIDLTHRDNKDAFHLSKKNLSFF